jgi:hypothetical protein
MSNIQKTLFEENYLIRSLGALATRPDIALTELVANAWDAGASKVDITIPKNENEGLIVEDNGSGMTKDQFHARWMRLGYNRIAHQGKDVIFPPGQTGKRRAYGRNGIGRHGLLCFNDEYTVTTCSEGKQSKIIISTSSEDAPFIIKSEKITDHKGYGTRLEVNVIRNLPDANRMFEIISSRFLHDPQFIININKRTATLETHPSIVKRQIIDVDENIHLEISLVDTSKAHRRILYQGIAFWQDNRLVGEPSWILGKNSIIDGRTRIGKQFVVIVKTNDLGEYIKEDWSGFKKHEKMDLVYKKLSKQVDLLFEEIAKSHISEIRDEVEKEFGPRIAQLSLLGRHDVNEFVNQIAVSSYSVQQNVKSKIIEAFINLESSRNGQELLRKISVLNDDDVSGLNRLLDQWTVKDALTVLDEIDLRLTIIEAIRKLSSDKGVDELKVLHPLVTEARWVFGPEFDSNEYTSNKTLQTAAKEIFGVDGGSELFENPHRRPDLVVMGNSTISLTGTEDFNNDNLVELKRVLIIELKRGKYEISREERDQAVHYAEDFTCCKSIIGNPYITAFVVGDTISNKLQTTHKIVNESGIERGSIKVTTFSQLVDTAERRLFRLRTSLNTRYEGIPGMELANRVLNQKLIS